jgi:hypothetical protein
MSLPVRSVVTALADDEKTTFRVGVARFAIPPRAVTVVDNRPLRNALEITLCGVP